MQKQTRIQLPKGISPTHYFLSLRPNLTDFTFFGSVKVDLNVSSSSDKIVLHSLGLNFSAVEVSQNDSVKTVKPGDVIFSETNETASIPASLQSGSAKLKIEFSGEINDKMHGFYRSTFKDSSGQTSVVGCTQFEATDARRALPCWDEPAHKATFDVEITAPQNLTVLSNTAVRREAALPHGLKTVVFETTPKMSTYLLAWFLGEYGRLSATTKNGVDVAIYTPRESLAKGKWALSVATQTIDFFEEYFGIRYPLAKLDMLAISDFVNGAMENWGLVTYRDTAIYCDENSSVKAREWVTAVVAHELAHQWFGNLVTMEWWSELWLNEGFATFMQALANARLYPQMEIWEQFGEEKLEAALQLDSMRSSHPVEVEIRSAKEINEVFDVISYKKGASLLRMLYEYIGDGDFKQGVSDYLRHYSYANSDSDGLWQFLSKASNKDVRGFMHLFTRQQGYPLIEVDLLESREGVHSLRFTQSRFLLDGSREAQTLWKVPMRVDINGRKEWFYLESRASEKDFRADGPFQWIFANSGASGFFRTKYSPELLEKLSEAIRRDALPSSDRFVLLSDAHALFEAGRQSAASLLGLIKQLSGEKNQLVWSSAIQSLSAVRVFLHENPLQAGFDRFANTLTAKIAASLGKKALAEEAPSDKKLRAQIWSLRALCEDAEAIAFLRTEFDRLRGGERIESDLFAPVVSSAMKRGAAEEFEAVKEIALSAEDPMQKNQALSSLGKSQDPAVVRKALELVFSDEVRKQDSFYVFIAAAYSPYGNAIAWDFFKENYETLRKTFAHDTLFSRFILVVNKFASQKLIDEAKAFFDSKNTEGYEKKLSQAFEYAEMNLKVKQRELPQIEAWLRRN